MSLSYALLGFLNYAPMTGYDLKKILDDSVNFFWSAQTSQIYRELKVLEKDGYIEAAVKPSEKGPNRHEYHITESGNSHLRKWLSEAHNDENMRNEFMVWLLFSSQVSKDEMYRQLQKKLQDYQKEYQMLREVGNGIQEYVQWFGKEDEDFYWKMVLKRGLYDVEAKIHWAEDMLNSLKLNRPKGKKDKTE
ncbi:MAG: PadR family transcriptional regulator [Methylocystaceae bacterium]